MQPAVRGTARTVVAVASLALLGLAGPGPVQAARLLLRAAPAVVTDPVVAAAALAGWALGGWLVAVALLTLAARLPGAAGRLAQGTVRRCAPAAVRRGVAVALGLGVVLSGAGPAGAAVAAPRSPSPAAGLDWPADAAPPVLPVLDWPTSGPQHLGKPGPPTSTQVGSPHATRSSRPAAVVVRPGDTLWGLAARSLGGSPSERAVAQAWPVWWSANRALIGPDPDLLQPGTALVPPELTDHR